MLSYGGHYKISGGTALPNPLGQIDIITACECPAAKADMIPYRRDTSIIGQTNQKPAI